MNDVLIADGACLPAMSRDDLDKVRALERVALEQPQVRIRTQHMFHAGMYARTITIPAGILLTGALIKRSTLLIAHGNAAVYIGDRVIAIDGYRVMPGAPGRKQVFLAIKDTDLTMIFPTDAKTVEEAEAEFTDETGMLFSRRDPELDTVIFTGE